MILQHPHEKHEVATARLSAVEGCIFCLSCAVQIARDHQRQFLGITVRQAAYVTTKAHLIARGTQSSRKRDYRGRIQTQTPPRLQVACGR